MSPLLHIAGIQSNLHWEDRKANLAMFEDKITSIVGPAEIVILPEMFSTGFSMKPEALAETMEGETLQWMKKIAATKRIILTGSIIIKENNDYFNRLIWMLPNGQLGFYDKRHLFAYGDEDQHYTAGSKRLIVSVNGWKINLLVCYDLRFPIWARQQPSESPFEYDVLIYVANWPEKRIHAWKALLQARAIENQCYVAGINRLGEDGNGIHYTGESMVIDPAGEILYHKKDAEDIFTLALEKSRLENIREKFPFWKDADGFEIKTNR
jgi:predicted amidohydrolase